MVIGAFPTFYFPTVLIAFMVLFSGCGNKRPALSAGSTMAPLERVHDLAQAPFGVQLLHASSQMDKRLLVYKSSLSMTQACDYYTKAMECYGWLLSSSYCDAEQESIFNFSKPGRFCTICIRPGRITIAIGQEE